MTGENKELENLASRYHAQRNEVGLLVLAIQTMPNKAALIDRLTATVLRRASDGKKSPTTSRQIDLLKSGAFPETVSCNALVPDVEAIVSAVTAKLPKRIDVVAIAMELLESGEDTTGVCRACGETQGCTEPDARHYECESCGAKQVFGAEQILIEGGGL